MWIDWFDTNVTKSANTPNQSQPGSNGKEEVTAHSSELEDLSLTIGCSLVSYLKHIFWGREWPLNKEYSLHILCFADNAVIH